MSRANNDIYLQEIEAYLTRTKGVASRLCIAATGSPNHISQMRQGKPVAARHYRAILLYMDAHPDGPPHIQTANRRGGRRKRVNNVDSAGNSHSMNGSTKIPVPGPSQLHPDLFEAIKAEAFRKGMTVVRFMEHIVGLGWERYSVPHFHHEEGARL